MTKLTVNELMRATLEAADPEAAEHERHVEAA